MRSEIDSEISGRPKNYVCCVVFSIVVICVTATFIACFIIFTTPASLQTVNYRFIILFRTYCNVYFNS